MITTLQVQLLSGILYLIILVIGIKKKKSLFTHFRIIFLFYLIGVISVTFFPLPVAKYMIVSMRRVNRLENAYNIVPFKQILFYLKNFPFSTILLEIGGNIMLSIPLGIFIPLLFKKFSSLARTMLIGVIFTLTIESMQLLIGVVTKTFYKSTDIDDVILNLLGTFIGFCIFNIVIQRYTFRKALESIRR